jgi:hypothetical protein
VGTYRIALNHSLRLEEELTHPTGMQSFSIIWSKVINITIGAVCGSSDLNDGMRKFAVLQLRDETYLEDPEEGITIANIVESEILPYFESDVKRAFDDKDDECF